MHFFMPSCFVSEIWKLVRTKWLKQQPPTLEKNTDIFLDICLMEKIYFHLKWTKYIKPIHLDFDLFKVTKSFPCSILLMVHKREKMEKEGKLLKGDLFD